MSKGAAVFDTCRKRFDAMDVSIELAACNLLLGDVTGAEAALGLGEAAHRGPDPAVKQFVMVPSLALLQPPLA